MNKLSGLKSNKNIKSSKIIENNFYSLVKFNKIKPINNWLMQHLTEYHQTDPSIKANSSSTDHQLSNYHSTRNTKKYQCPPIYVYKPPSYEFEIKLKLFKKQNNSFKY